MVLTSAILTLRPGLAAWQRSRVRAQLQASALISLRTVTGALERCRASEVLLFPSARADAHARDESARDALALLERDEAGSPSETTVTVLYVRPDTHELWRAELDASPPLPESSRDEDRPASPARAAIPPTALAALESEQQVPAWIGTHRRVAHSIRTLSVERTGTLLVLRLEAAEGTERCSLGTAVTPVLDLLGGASGARAP